MRGYLITCSATGKGEELGARDAIDLLQDVSHSTKSSKNNLLNRISQSACAALSTNISFNCFNKRRASLTVRPKGPARRFPGVLPFACWNHTRLPLSCSILTRVDFPAPFSFFGGFVVGSFKVCPAAAATSAVGAVGDP